MEVVPMDETMELYGDYDEYVADYLANTDFLNEFCEKRRHSYLDHGFIFHPSYRKTYLTLKEGDPNAAIRFLEALMAYGIDSVEPDPKDLLTCALLYGPMKGIDKSIRKYFNKMNKIRQEYKRLEDEAAQRIEKQEQAQRQRKEEAIRRAEAQELLRQDSTDRERA